MVTVVGTIILMTVKVRRAFASGKGSVRRPVSGGEEAKG